METEIKEIEGKFFECRPLKGFELWEYLDAEGNWSKNEDYFENYREDLRKLNYNFRGPYEYYISKTPKENNYEVIWRKLK